MRILVTVLSFALTSSLWAKCNIKVGHETIDNVNNDSYSAHNWKSVAKILRDKGYDVRLEVLQGIYGEIAVVANDFEGTPDYEIRSHFVYQNQMGYLVRGVELGIYDQENSLLSSAESFSGMSDIIGDFYSPNHLKKALKQLKNCSDLNWP